MARATYYYYLHRSILYSSSRAMRGIIYRIYCYITLLQLYYTQPNLWR